MDKSIGEKLSARHAKGAIHSGRRISFTRSSEK